jgi:nicotinamide riboside kinase
MDERTITIVPWQHRDTMRIGFSGSAGIGKTELCKAVNKILNYPVLIDCARDYLKENKIKDVNNLDSIARMKFQLAMLARKQATEQLTSNLIVDRTTLDTVAYTLYYLSDKEEFQRGVMDYVRDATIHAAKTYDVIFILPYGQFPIKDDGIRKPLPAHQMMIHMLIEHTVEKGVGPFHVHQITSESVEDRVTEVLEVVNKMQTIKDEVRMKMEMKNGDKIQIPESSTVH